MLLSRFLRLLLLPRLLGGRRRGAYRGYGRPRRGPVGMLGPFPAYSTRTRGGARVTVSGCCLPIPLTLAAAGVTAARVLRRP
jgi:hypothetical protein